MEPERPGADAETVIRLLVKRSELIACLREGPTYKRDLQEQLDVSRSTVYKAVRELEEYDIVEQTNGGHQLTLLGRLLDREYRTFFESVSSICTPGGLLALLPSDCRFDPDALVGGEVIRSERHAPNRPVEAVERIVTNASALRGMTPVALPQYVSIFRDRIVEGELTAELVLQRPVVEYVFSVYGEQVAESFASGNLDIKETTEALPFGLIVTDEPDTMTVVLVYDDEGSLKGVIRNASRAAFEWGAEIYESYRQNATDVTPTES